MKRHTTHDNPSIWEQLLPLVAAAVLLATNLCLFGPFEIYLPNQPDLDSAFHEVLPYLLAYAGVLTVIIAALGVVLPRRVRRWYVATVLVVGVLLWVEGSFLKWGYGELDGRGIDWSRFTWQAWVDGGIWFVGVGAAAMLRRSLSRHATFVAIAFIVLQSGFAMVRARGTHETSPAQDATTIPEAMTTVSKSQNIFHIIMDSFQTDVFMELVEEEGYAQNLDGFVVYTDNLSVGKRTVLCVPAIFSGEIYDGSVQENEYFRTAIQHSFHNVLYDNGYVVNLMPRITMENTKYTNHFHSPAIYAASRHTRLLRTSSYLVDVSMFRQLPHFAKRFIYNDQNWRLSSLVGTPPTHESFYQKAFFQDYIHRLRAVRVEPTYNFIHLMPPHPPLVTLADGSDAGRALPNTRENYKNEARAILKLFMDFLARLHDLGIYDSSIIILQGDHGAGFTRTEGGKQASKLASRVSALLAVKPAGEHGPMQTSSVPSTIADIPATVMDMVGLHHNYPGASLLRLGSDPDRDREVVTVTDRSTNAPVMHRWTVRGVVADSTSWHEMPALAVRHNIPHYEWGQTLGFGITGEGAKYLSRGWSTTSPTVHWNDGSTAELTFGIDPPDRDVHLRFTFFPHIVPGKVDRQRIIMKINDFDVGSVTATENKSFHLDITVRRDVLQSDRMVVAFEFPDAVSPQDIGEGRDPRKLAMGLYSFESELVDGAQ